jgi:hypothetical protein
MFTPLSARRDQDHTILFSPPPQTRGRREAARRLRNPDGATKCPVQVEELAAETIPVLKPKNVIDELDIVQKAKLTRSFPPSPITPKIISLSVEGHDASVGRVRHVDVPSIVDRHPARVVQVRLCDRGIRPDFQNLLVREKLDVELGSTRRQRKLDAILLGDAEVVGQHPHGVLAVEGNVSAEAKQKANGSVPA